MFAIGIKYEVEVELSPEVEVPSSWYEPLEAEIPRSESDSSESLDFDPLESKTFSLSTNAFSNVNYDLNLSFMILHTLTYVNIPNCYLSTLLSLKPNGYE